MPYCSNCGQEMESNAKFCSNCGISIITIINENRNQRKIKYEGIVHKCPNCGEILNSFNANCPACGHEIRDSESASSIQKLAIKLERIEARKMPIFEEKKSVMKMVFGRDFKNEDAAKEARDSFEKQKQQEKANLIINYSVPNTKEDIMEFLLLASSNIDIKHGINDDVSKAWISKLEQVYQKAKLSFSDTQEFAKIQIIYEQKKKEVQSGKRKSVYPWIGYTAMMIAIIVFCLTMGSIASFSDAKKIETENKRLEAVVEEVYEALGDNDYTLARAKAANIVFSGSTTDDGKQAKEKWDKTRDELLLTIDSYQGGKSNNVFSEGSTETFKVKNYSFDIPTYWKESSDQKLGKRFYAESGDKVAMLDIEYAIDNKDPVNLDTLYADNANMIASIEGMFTDCKVINYKDFESDNGIKGILYRFNFRQEVEQSKYDLTGLCLCFPSTADSRWFYVMLTITDNVEKDYYEADYLNTIASIRSN